MRACVLCILLALAGCGGEGTGAGTTSTHPAQADGGLPAHLDPPAPSPDAQVLAADSRALTPEASAAAGCPSPAQLAGAYAGTFDGTAMGVIPVALKGTITFTLVASGNDLSIQNGKAQGSTLGVSYQLPIGGTVVCGKLDGSGTGVILTVTLAGSFKATWAAGSFSDGTWSGQDAQKLANANGTWTATRK
jgi:hypothetical protein